MSEVQALASVQPSRQLNLSDGGHGRVGKCWAIVELSIEARSEGATDADVLHDDGLPYGSQLDSRDGFSAGYGE